MDSVSPQCIESFWQAGVAKGAFKSRLESEAGIEAAGWRCPPLSGLRCKIARLFFLSSIEVFSAKKAESRALWMLVYDFRVWHVAGRTVKHEAGDTSFGSRPRSTCAQTNMFLLFYLFIFEKKTFNRYFLRGGGEHQSNILQNLTNWISIPIPIYLFFVISKCLHARATHMRTRAYIHITKVIILRQCFILYFIYGYIAVFKCRHDKPCLRRLLLLAVFTITWHSCACGGPYFCIQLSVLQSFVLPYAGRQYFHIIVGG